MPTRGRWKGQSYTQLRMDSPLGKCIAKCIALERDLGKRGLLKRSRVGKLRHEIYACMCHAMDNHFEALVKRCQRKGIDHHAILGEAPLVNQATLNPQDQPKPAKPEPVRPKVDSFGAS
jgi:hypothetical protein